MLSQVDEYSRGSTTELDILPSVRPFVFAYLVLSNQVACLTVEKPRDRSLYHSRFITSIKYQGDASNPYFKIDLDEILAIPGKITVN